MWNGKECGKNKVMRISNHVSAVQNMVNQNNWRMWNISTIWGA
jgi:hypothetical protein